MFTAEITFAGSHRLWPAALALVAAIGMVLWSYRGAPRRPLFAACALLKTLGIAALLFCLLEPLWASRRARPGANLFLVLADNSRGLEIKDSGETLSRSGQMQNLLRQTAGGWMEALEREFQVRRFLFDSQLKPCADFERIPFDGRASALGAALEGLGGRFQGQPVAGVLLLTDGIATDLRSSMPDLRNLPPIYPVLIGRPGALKDLAVDQLRVTQTPFEDAPVTLQADVRVAGLNRHPVRARLVDPSGRSVGEQTLTPARNQQTLAFRFQWKPDRPGVSFYRLEAGLSDETQAGLVTNRTAEATLVNNSRMLAVDRGRGPYRILYVSGRPNWEYKYLNRALQADEQIQLVSLVRIALREPKFEFRGRVGETGNPLFRGFGDQSREEVERYDQPVLVRLNTRDDMELRTGFPVTAEDLYGYDAVILDDLEAAFFKPDQAMLVQKFVSERGGGLLMLGGAESFQQGGYHRTPIGDALPVYLDRTQESASPPELKFNLTREGWLQPWLRLRDNEGDENARLQSMPAFQVFNFVRDTKPGASVLATATDSQGKAHPALVTQRFGRGKTAALLVGDFWRWGMQDQEARRDMDKAWRQLIRWLIADTPRPVEIAAELPAIGTSEGLHLRVRVRDKKFQPMDDATVTVTIETAATNAVPGSNVVARFVAEPSPTEAGAYETLFIPRESGAFRASATVTNASGVEVGRAETGWTFDPMAEEFASLEPNAALLESIATRTGGAMVPAAQLPRFVRELPRKQAPIMEPWSYPIWHHPLMLTLALGCLIAEWGLRRWRGLP